jgi:two-component system nitrate/nitrite sensor histidine kinase NarX
MSHRRWTLTNRIALFAAVVLLLSLGAIGVTLWASWNLQGGAAAVNEAGRLRMLTYRMTLMAERGDAAAVAQSAAQMQASLDLLRRGDQSRPLFVPWNDAVRQRYDAVLAQWRALQPRWLQAPADEQVPSPVAAHFVATIDAFVTSIEKRLDFWTSLLYTLQFAMAAMMVLGALLLFYAAYLFVLDPVRHLSRGVEAIETGNYSARVDIATNDEFGDLAKAFNGMAAQLGGVHAELEQRVLQKTAALRTEQQRLAALYEVSALVSKAQSLDELSQSFVQVVRRIAGADAAALRWTDESARRYLLLASDGLPPALAEEEQCLMSDTCFCGQAQHHDGPKIVQFHRLQPEGQTLPGRVACERLGYATLLSIPVRAQQRLLGEIDLFFHTEQSADDAQHALLDTLAGHVAAAMESLRSAALEREAAVSQERAFLARELHDSIAQSLAFMKIQLQLLRTALQAGKVEKIEQVVSELDVGVKESLADVRELLLHFRTRTQEQDIEPALRSTVQKFELQSGLSVDLVFHEHGQPLDPDVQIQVLHIVQEALSNIRKHARATQARLVVDSLPRWRFVVSDDGRGYDPAVIAQDGQAHVGQQIMRERAAAIGGQLSIEAQPNGGVRVTLELPEFPAAASGRATQSTEIPPYAA